MTNFEIRPATEQDVPVILNLIRELAEYEREPDAVVATEAGLREVLFGPKPSAEVLLALEEGAPVGFAVYFYNFSTWLGRPGLYLEDLFVRPAARGKGYGRALLVELAKIARKRGCGREQAQKRQERSVSHSARKAKTPLLSNRKLIARER